MMMQQANKRGPGFRNSLTLGIHLKQWVLGVCLLVIGMMVNERGWGQIATYTVASNSSVTSGGTTPSGSSATYSQTFATISQITTGNTATLTLTGYAGYKITGILLSMKSNASAGAGTLNVVAGSTNIASVSPAATFSSASWYGAYSTSYVTISKTPTAYNIGSGENVVITIAATVNSLYIQSYSITYTSVSCIPPTDPIGNITPAANPACSSTTLSYSGASSSIYWQSSSTGTSTTYPTTSNYLTSGTGTYYVRSYNGSCWSTNSLSSPLITINTAASVSIHPTNQNATTTGTASFTTAGSGTVSWEVNTGSGWVAVTNGGVYSGVATSTLAITNPVLGMNGYQYRAVFTPSSPCSAVNSNAATLMVNTGPCHTEDFGSIGSSSTYSTKTWSGTGGTWSATDAREDQTISGKAITIRSGVLTSPSFSDGVSSITLTTKFPFSESSGDLVIAVNGYTVGTILFSDMSGTTPITKTFSGINVSGNVIITATSSGTRYTIDDLNWVCFNGPEINLKQNTTSIASGTGSYNFGSQQVSTSSSATSFTIENLGTATLTLSGSPKIAISGTNAADFSIDQSSTSSTIAASTNTAFSVIFTPSAAGNRTATISIANDDADENPYTFTISGTGTYAATSTITENSTSYNNGTPSTKIEYLTYQSTPGIGSSVSGTIGVMKFRINDIGGDGQPTIATELRFTVKDVISTNQISQIRHAVLATTSNSIKAVATISGTELVFSSLSATDFTTATDDGSAKYIEYILRVSYKSDNNIVDNSKFVFKVSSATASTAGSVFAASDAGGATSDASTDNRNRINVTADRLRFTTQPVDQAVNTNLVAFTVKAVDANSNVDTDVSSTFTVTTSGTGMTSGSPYTLTNGSKTISDVQFNAVQGPITLTATTSGLSFDNDDISSSFSIVNVTSGSYRTTGVGTWNGSATWERFTAGWVSSSAPTSGNTTDMIYIRHAVSFVGSMSFGKITIESGGKLTNPSSGNISGNLLVQSGGTLQVNGSLTVSGSFEVEDNGIVNLNHNFLSPSSSIWAGTENFHPSSNLVIQYWDFSQNLIASNTTVTANTYSGYTACFGNISIDVGSNTTSWNMLPSGFSVNLGHGNLSFLSNAANVNLATTGTVTTGIGGNFNIDNAYTGSNYVTLKTSGTSNFTVKGSVQLDAATLRILAGSTAGSSSTLNIEGDLNISPSAVLDFNSTVAGGSPAPLATINLKGDLAVAGSANLYNTNASNNGVFNFNGVGDGLTTSTTQTIDVASTGANRNRYINFNVTSGAYVQLANRDLELGASSTFTVKSIAVFDFNFTGTTPNNIKIVSGASSTAFTSETLSTLKISSPQGIVKTANSTTGNVQGVPVSNRSFDQVATFHYIGKTNQVTGDAITTGSTAKVIICELIDNNTQLSFTNNTAISQTTTVDATYGGHLYIKKGQVIESATGYITNSGGTLRMEAGTLYYVPVGFSNTTAANSDVIPRLAGGNANSYYLTGGTIEFAGSGTSAFQAIRGARTYYNVKFSGANTYGTDFKFLSSNATIDNSLIVTGNSVLDCRDLAGNATDFTGNGGLEMTGGYLRLKTASTTAATPRLSATNVGTTYSLTGGIIEFYGSTASTQQRIRGSYGNSSTVIDYYNIEVNADVANYNSIFSNAGNVDLNSSFTLQGTMNVNSPAVLRMDESDNIYKYTGNATNNVNIKSGAGLLYGSQYGITTSMLGGTGTTAVPNPSAGNIRTSIRSFSTGASYGFIGAGDMPTGSGLPTTVAGLYAFKTNSSDKVTFTNPALVSGSGSELHLTSGVLVTTSTNLITLKPEAVVSGGSSNSFVSGPLAKQTDATNTPVGTYEFTFPIGKTSPSSQYKPAYVLPATASGTTTYTAEYFPANPAMVYNQAFLGNLIALYKHNYWKIDRGNLETGTARVALDYSPGGAASDWVLQGGLTSPAAISPNTNVAITKNFSTYWNFTKSDGNFNNVGPMYEARYYTSSGKIYSGILNSFSPFTFGYSYNVILPVKLLAFTGRLMNADGLLEWSIADARDLDGFELEYSTDGSSYQSLAKIGSNGSTRYSFLHKKLPAGTNYYRLRVKEKGGNQYYSQVVMLNMGKLKTYVIGLAPTVVGTQLTTAIFAANAQKLQARITDVLGRQLWTGSKNLAEGTNQWNIDTHDLPKGLYFISLETPDGLKETLRFIKE